MYPWLRNKAVPFEQLKPVTQLNSHGSRSFLSVLGVAKRRGLGKGLSATFRDRGWGRRQGAWALLPSSGADRPREATPSPGTQELPLTLLNALKMSVTGMQHSLQ